MDVRKWLTNKLTEMRFLGEYGSTESLLLDYTEKIVRELDPPITKLVEAAQQARNGFIDCSPTATLLDDALAEFRKK